VGSQVFQKKKIRKDRMERNSDGGIFAHSKFGKYVETHLGILDDKQLPRTSSLTPHVMGDKAFPVKTYLMRPYPGSQSMGTM
jgi:hypothetical protein